MKFLFVNACIRDEASRTQELCRDYIDKFFEQKKEQGWSYEEIVLNDAEIQPLNRETLARRDELLAKNDFSDSMFDLAKQLIEADHILVGAPYWDLSFPAKLKIYLERCSVTGLTFVYDRMGIPHGQCKAKALVYITTSGSPIGDFNFGYDYIKGLCGLFGIENAHLASAEGLDIIGNDVEKIMCEAKDKITDIIEAI